MIGWTIYLICILAVLYATALVYSARKCLHYYQLESYQSKGYVRSVFRQWKQAFLPSACIYLPGVIAGVIAASWNKELRAIVPLAVSCVCAMLTGYAFSVKAEKKPFVVTARIKRLICSLFMVLALLIFPAYLYIPEAAPFLPLPLLLPVWVFAAGILSLPVEKLIFLYYFHDAQKKLAAQNGLIRIGITGSYGKTSVKFILQTILSQKYNVLATPASYNTPMGVTRIIRDRLLPEHHVFIAEMGARHVGDIKEMCRLVHPSIGILTSIGPQHLQTFKTIERIAETKNELMEALPLDGFGVFSQDDQICSRLYRDCKKTKLLAGGPESDCWVENAQVSQCGSLFTVCFRDGARIDCETRLLGEHNVRNILLSCAVARHMGLSEKQIKMGVSMLQPVEHRLQLLKTMENITVIDDAFNSNPHGCHVALNVLRSFPGRRIIVTPGMVELGDKEAEYNHEFGAEMASCVNFAFLIGKKHTKPIADGLLENKFPESHIQVCHDLGAATAALNAILQPGDVVLYENDLPDHYSEK
jgi:UDP-N-acetylmuramoyl-tripeptide--D-alanyl-D-alanine ligase